jgi:hypothetical protein
VNPPIFIRFQLDGQTAKVRDLNNISKSAILSTTVSVFKANKDGSKLSLPRQLPFSHKAFSVEITALLKSYVAEQTLERLRGAHDMSSEDNLHLVRRCLSRIQSVVTFTVEIYFYISRRDMMMPAAAPAGGEAEVSEGFHILDLELQNNGSFILKPVPGASYLISSTIEQDEPLEFWCLLNVQNTNGIISSQIYHPGGEEAALGIMTRVHDMLCACIHRANQQLLLRR